MCVQIIKGRNCCTASARRPVFCFLLSITISIGQLYFAICCGEQLPCSFPPKLLSSRGQVKFQLVRCCLCALFSAPSRWLLWSFGAKACWFLCKKRTNSSKSAKKVRSNLQLNPGRGIETLDLTWLKIKIFTVNYEYKFKNSHKLFEGPTLLVLSGYQSFRGLLHFLCTKKENLIISLR